MHYYGYGLAEDPFDIWVRRIQSVQNMGFGTANAWQSSTLFQGVPMSFKTVRRGKNGTLVKLQEGPIEVEIAKDEAIEVLSSHIRELEQRISVEEHRRDREDTGIRESLSQTRISCDNTLWLGLLTLLGGLTFVMSLIALLRSTGVIHD